MLDFPLSKTTSIDPWLFTVKHLLSKLMPQLPQAISLVRPIPLTTFSNFPCALHFSFSSELLLSVHWTTYFTQCLPNCVTPVLFPLQLHYKSLCCLLFNWKVTFPLSVSFKILLLQNYTIKSRNA
jgi:hypothetical protein